jgi:hypothetical protein
LSNPTSIRNLKPDTQPQRNTLTLKKRNKFRFEFDEPSHGRLDTNFAGVGGGVLGAVMGGGAVMSVFGCQWESFS